MKLWEVSLNYNVWYRQGQFTYQGRPLSLEPSTGTSRLLTCPAKRNWISVLLIASSSSSIAFPKGNKLSFALRLSEATWIGWKSILMHRKPVCLNWRYSQRQHQSPLYLPPCRKGHWSIWAAHQPGILGCWQALSSTMTSCFPHLFSQLLATGQKAPPSARNTVGTQSMFF